MHQLATNIALILTKLRGFQLFDTSQNSISNFFEKKLGFHAVVLVKTFPLMYQLATNVGLILTKLRGFQLFDTSKSKFNFKLLWKKKLGFHAVVLVKTFPLVYQLATNVGLILTKPGWFIFLGYGQTDTVLESWYGNMSAHKKIQLKAQN